MGNIETVPVEDIWIEALPDGTLVVDVLVDGKWRRAFSESGLIGFDERRVDGTPMYSIVSHCVSAAGIRKGPEVRLI